LGKTSSLYFEKADFEMGIENNGNQSFLKNCISLVCKYVSEQDNVLHIGCGDGSLSLLVAEFCQCKVEGIDIDPHVIRKARLKLTESRSLNSGVSPISCLTLGAKLNYSKDSTIHYKCADIITMPLLNSYSVLLCLSVTKWIASVQENQALEDLFTRFYNLLEPNGILILDLLQWSNYKKKENLEIKPEQFPAILNKLGFELVESNKGNIHAFKRH
jgi:SAM-dependent methyltransferase